MNDIHLLEQLWQFYSQSNPQARQIHQLLEDNGETIINDHIAFRTINDERLNLHALGKVFQSIGYHPIETYTFPQKKLTAMHFEHENSKQPKIFISQLHLEAFSKRLQNILQACFNQIKTDNPLPQRILYSGRHWGDISYKTYCELAEESEYAAWLYCFGLCPNHFTISVNHLKQYTSLEALNDFLMDHDFELNLAGGLIKGSPSQCLEQSSTLAYKVKLNFIEGTYAIPYCYYEFAKRYKKDGTLFQGFISQSADKIFQSTDRQ